MMLFDQNAEACKWAFFACDHLPAMSSLLALWWFQLCAWAEIVAKVLVANVKHAGQGR